MRVALFATFHCRGRLTYDECMRIGQLADEAGLTSKTIRYYESIGLLAAPERQANGYRHYDRSTLERLAFIRDAQAAGLSLSEVGRILQMKADGEGTCEHTRSLLHHHLDDVTEQIRRLEAAKAELEALVSRADALDPASCTDPSRCQVIALDLPVEGKVYGEGERPRGGHEHGTHKAPAATARSI